jgi:hypothetical protein
LKKLKKAKLNRKLETQNKEGSLFQNKRGLTLKNKEELIGFQAEVRSNHKHHLILHQTEEQLV